MQLYFVNLLRNCITKSFQTCNFHSNWPYCKNRVGVQGGNPTHDGWMVAYFKRMNMQHY